MSRYTLEYFAPVTLALGMGLLIGSAFDGLWLLGVAVTGLGFLLMGLNTILKHRV